MVKTDCPNCDVHILKLCLHKKNKINIFLLFKLINNKELIDFQRVSDQFLQFATT